MYTCTIQVLTTAVIGMDAPNMVGSVLPKSPLEMTENKTDIIFPERVKVLGRNLSLYVHVLNVA